MQFICKIPLIDEALALIFMCQNDPGMCDEWDPNLGGNVVKVVPSHAIEAVQIPTEGNTLLPLELHASLSPFEGSYGDALRSDLSKRILGKFGGTPDWVQGEETPSCNLCAQPMSFVAQIEQGTDGRSEMNFGGGLAFLFGCASCHDQSKFLWQC